MQHEVVNTDSLSDFTEKTEFVSFRASFVSASGTNSKDPEDKLKVFM